MEVGYESRWLAALAGQPPTETYESGALFDAALVELGADTITDAAAALLLSREIARQIIDHSTSPIDGARAIWSLSLKVDPTSVPELHTFIYAALEWDDRSDSHRRLFEEGVRAAARDLAERT